MSQPILNTAVPILASLDIATTVRFYTEELGFRCRFESQGEYAIVDRDSIELHFWPCDDADIAGNTACRVGVTGIAALYDEYSARGVLRPDCKLHNTPWQTREFEVFDPHSNLITFFERNVMP
jgi:catechol 2,3-dioxygenase-like lactoylglutathione lyase family enzyme